MLIDSFAPHPDAIETHRITIAASREAVYQALWTCDLANSVVIKALLGLRSLPEFILHPNHPHRHSTKATLQTLIDAGFGKLAEEPGHEIVLDVTGRFWRPT